MSHSRSLRFNVERLEARTLLSTMRGVDSDGDHFRITVKGSGEILSVEGGVIDVTGTTNDSHIVVRPGAKRGDGVVDIVDLDTHGAALGRLVVRGHLNGLHVGDVERIRVLELGSDSGDGQFHVQGSLGHMLVTRNAAAARLTVDGQLNSLVIRGDSQGFEVQTGKLGLLEVRGSMRDTGISADGSIDQVKAAWIEGSAIRSGDVLDHLLSEGDLIDSTISARQAINTIEVMGSSDGNIVMAGLDVGRDLRPGSGDETRFIPIQPGVGIIGCEFLIFNDMIDTVVAVGVDPMDGIFGNGDDTAITNEAEANIGLIAVQGQILASESGQTVIMSADKIGSVTHQNGIQFTAAPGVQMITLRKSS